MIYLLETNSYCPYFNLAFEEYFFLNKKRGDVYLFFWQNDKSVIIGKYQNAYEEIDSAFARENNINIVRRNSGGGAVYHDKGNLNYSIITDFDVKYDIKKLCEPMIEALKKFGAKVWFKGRNDIFCEDAKISGNAQYISHNKILHHGTLLVNTDLTALSKVLTSKTKFTDSSATKSVKSKVSNLNDFLKGKVVSVQEIKREILRDFEGYSQFKLSAKHIDEIKTLEQEKYRTDNWNFGKMPEFNYTCRKRFSFGTLGISAIIENNQIKHIAFEGDFFAFNDLDKLQTSMVGIKLNCLDQELGRRKVYSYIRGASPADISSLFDSVKV